jgi:tripartite-type tricarboxylate transporter receptor subunit TctC
VATLNRAVNAALADWNLIARFAEVGGRPMPMTPDEFSKFVGDDVEKWAKVVKYAGLKPE